MLYTFKRYASYEVPYVSCQTRESITLKWVLWFALLKVSEALKEIMIIATDTFPKWFAIAQVNNMAYMHNLHKLWDSYIRLMILKSVRKCIFKRTKIYCTE